MCGIVGYTGKKDAVKIVVDGLEKLEYRGYDSAGVAVIGNGSIEVQKYEGRLAVLKEHLKHQPMSGHTAIGHTRWASHGAPSDKNAHPHSSPDGMISIVHNGIIENYVQLRKELEEKGYTFTSETDTETAAVLIRDLYDGDLLDAVIAASEKLKGAYAICAVCAGEPDRIVTARKDSPLIAGIGKHEQFVASDIPAVLEYTRNIYLIDDDTFCDITPEEIKIYDANKQRLEKEVFKVTWSAQAAAKGEYKHFMLKEIFEQPEALTNTLRGRISSETDEVEFADFDITQQDFAAFDRIMITACGTAYYAGCAAKSVLEEYSGKRVDSEIASEYRYSDTRTNEKTLLIAISQSGETADTLASMRLAKKKGAKVLAVTNVVGSSVAREADTVLYTLAGPEIAVASTKAYSTQVLCLYLLALKFGNLSKAVSDEKLHELKEVCLALPSLAQNALFDEETIKEVSKAFKKSTDAFYIGRGLDAAISLEGSLKMKEISYIHAEAYPAGELKHGPIALIEKDTPVVALCTQSGELSEKTLSNIKEVNARGAFTIVIANKRFRGLEGEVDKVIYIDDTSDPAEVIPAVIKLQLLAYYTAVEKGCDVDKPRNLAKSVTIE